MEDEYKDVFNAFTNHDNSIEDNNGNANEPDPRWKLPEFTEELQEHLNQINNLFNNPLENLENIYQHYKHIHGMITNNTRNKYVPKNQILNDSNLIHYLCDTLKNFRFIELPLLNATLELIIDLSNGDECYIKSILNENYLDTIYFILKYYNDETTNKNTAKSLVNLFIHFPDQITDEIFVLIFRKLFNSCGDEVPALAKIVQIFITNCNLDSYEIKSRVFDCMVYLLGMNDERVFESAASILIYFLIKSKNISVENLLKYETLLQQFMPKILSYNPIRAMQLIYIITKICPDLLDHLGLTCADLFDKIDHEDADTSLAVFVALSEILLKHKIEALNANFANFASLANDILGTANDTDFLFKRDSLIFISSLISTVDLQFLTDINLLQYLNAVEDFVDSCDEEPLIIQICKSLISIDMFIKVTQSQDEFLIEKFKQIIEITLETTDDFDDKTFDEFRNHFGVE